MQIDEAMDVAFEGFEKRLEVEFFPSKGVCNHGGLRSLTRSQLDHLLEPAQCTIVSELHNNAFDSYVLSESSLFVYPFRIILKTCGRTQLLKSLPSFLHHASQLSLQVCRCKYTRGTFIFPLNQPFPYTCFGEEVRYLDQFFGELGPGRKAFVLGDASRNQNWHIYSAVAENFHKVSTAAATFTLEMCMTQLDTRVASQFFNESGSKSGKEMTQESGIDALLPHAQICDFSFAPCGYSMNGMEGDALSTIHITPEETHSYASFETMGYNPEALDLQALVNRVVSCFQPATFVMSVHVSGPHHDGKASRSWGSTVLPFGYVCDCSNRQELCGGSVVTFHTFRKRSACGSIVIPQALFPLIHEKGAVDEPSMDEACMHEKNDSLQSLSCGEEDGAEKPCVEDAIAAIQPSLIGSSIEELDMFLRHKISSTTGLSDHFCVMDLGRMVRLWDAWSSALPRIRPYYDLHWNSDGCLVSLLAALGAGFYVSDKAQVAALDTISIAPDRVIICTDDLSELASHIDHTGPLLTTVTSEMELFLLERLNPEAKVILRYRPDGVFAGCSWSPQSGEFVGPAIEQLLLVSKKLKLQVIGVALDLAWNCVTYGEGLRAARRIFEIASSSGHAPLKLLDVGEVLMSDLDGRWSETAARMNVEVEKYFPWEMGVELIANARSIVVEEAVTLTAAVKGATQRGEEGGREVKALWVGEKVKDLVRAMEKRGKSAEIRAISGWSETAEERGRYISCKDDATAGDWVAISKLAVQTRPIHDPKHSNGESIPSFYVYSYDNSDSDEASSSYGGSISSAASSVLTSEDEQEDME